MDQRGEIFTSSFQKLLLAPDGTRGRSAIKAQAETDKDGADVVTVGGPEFGRGAVYF